MANSDSITIHAFVTHIDCPHCGATQTGFVGDPRGSDFNCDACGREFSVPETAEVDLGGLNKVSG